MLPRKANTISFPIGIIVICLIEKTGYSIMNNLFTAPRAGLEPATTRLTAECSTIELSRNIYFILTKWRSPKKLCFWGYVRQPNLLKMHVPSKLHTENVFHHLFLSPDPPSGHALDRLVTVSSIHCCTSTSALSTSSSSRGLTNFRYGRTHLEGGFTLRCLQRLSLPNLATLPCTW